MHPTTVHNRRAGQVLSPDQPHPGRVPYADGGTVPWKTLTPRQQDQVRAWLTGHGIDPTRVPLDGLFEYDPDTDEWRIEIVCHDDASDRALPSAVLRLDGTLATVVRRVWARSRDLGRKRGRGGRLVTNPPYRVEFAGIDVTPYLEASREHRRAQW
jgi:hypothetical protein